MSNAPLSSQKCNVTYHGFAPVVIYDVSPMPYDWKGLAKNINLPVLFISFAAIRLDAEEFLKHFKSDGHTSAIEEALSPIGMTTGSVAKSSHTQQYDENILKDKEQSFEAMVKHKYPGIRWVMRFSF